MSRPTVSIVTPSYNQGRYIEYTVKSVLEQSYPNIEYIMMDGGSTDETVSVLNRYQDRFASMTSAKDGGQADAIARGFERSTGDIMAYLNSDDVLAPYAVEFVVDYFEKNPHVDAIYSHRIFIDRENIVRNYWLLWPHNTYLMSRFDYVPQETLFWRRRLFEKGGNIDPSYQFAMDYDLLLRYFKIGRFKRVNRFLGAFRQHPAGKTTRLMEEVGREEIRRAQEKHGISVSNFDLRLYRWLHKSILYRSALHFASEKIIPGGGPGLGYDYCDIWAGKIRPELHTLAESA